MYDKVMKDGKSMMQLKKEFGGAMEMSHMKKSPMEMSHMKKSAMDHKVVAADGPDGDPHAHVNISPATMKSPMDKSPMDEAHMKLKEDSAMDMSHMKLTQDAAMKLTSALKKKMRMVKGPDGNMVPDFAVDGKGAGDLKK